MAAELHQEGLQHFLELMKGSQSPQANYYLGLATDASLAENATLTSLTEVSGTGYARQTAAMSGATSETTGTNDWRLVLPQVTFTAGGTWTGANTWFIATVVSGTSGKLIASGPLAATRTLLNGDTEKVTATLQLNG